MSPVSAQPISSAAWQAAYLSLADVGGWHLQSGTSSMRLTAQAAEILGFDAGTQQELLVEREELCARIHWGDRAEFRACWEKALEGQPYEMAYRLLLGPGETRWICEAFGPAGGRADRAAPLLGVVQDVTCRRLGVIHHDGMDPLTGLPGRQFATEHLEHLISQARRNQSRLGVLFVDLDRFKQVNDALGHEAGDAVLREVAARMKACLREGDAVVRYGGDEFLVILPQIAEESDGGLVALKLVETVGAAYEAGGVEVHIGASVGIAIFPEDGLAADVLVRQADAAMYRSKSAGRNTLSFFDPQMAAAQRERAQMEADLRVALANGDFVLHYQPICHAGSGQMHALEALIRWQHPERGLQAPQLFLPCAEETGLIRELGRWVVREVCWQLSRWSGSEFLVAINVSAAQIPAGLSPDWLRWTFEQSGVDPRRLVFEITESAPVLESEDVRRWLAEVQAMGVRVALDAFGSGHSSFAYLKCLNPRHLKIDKSYVQGMLREPEQMAVVKAMIALGQTMGLSVTAEGVEDEATLLALRELGCELVQGFHLAHPRPACELPEHLTGGPQATPDYSYAAQGAVASGRTQEISCS